MTGTPNLEHAIDYMLWKMARDQLDNVHGEDVPLPPAVTEWRRGTETAELLHPHRKKLAILGLGGSVGTPHDGVTAELLVVRNFAHLAQKADKARGKKEVVHRNWNEVGTSLHYSAKFL